MIFLIIGVLIALFWNCFALYYFLDQDNQFIRFLNTDKYYNDNIFNSTEAQDDDFMTNSTISTTYRTQSEDIEDHFFFDNDSLQFGTLIFFLGKFLFVLMNIFFQSNFIFSFPHPLFDLAIGFYHKIRL